MKPWIRFLLGAALAASAAATAPAQIIRVELISPVNESATDYNPGASAASAVATIEAPGILTVSVDNPGSGYTAAPTVTITGGGVTNPTGSTTINAAGTVTGITVSPTTGYTAEPMITLSPPTAPGGTQATVKTALTVGSVKTISFTPGSGYLSPPAITFTGGGNPTTPATATATLDAKGAISTITFTGGAGYTSVPTVEIAAPPGVITVTARNTGSNGFSTEFFVNGNKIGNGGGSLPSVSWNPPQPGAYFITAKTSDGFGNTGTTIPVRVFVKGAKIFSPIAHTALPLGSSIVVSADAEVGATAVNPFTNQTVFTPGFIRQIEFFVTDASGATRSVGVATTAPYSVRYATTALGFYNFTATATDNNGQTMTSPDLVDIQVVNPIGTPPRSAIVNPVNNGSVTAGSTVNIIADAGWAPDEPNPGIIVKTEFYLNGTLLSTDSTFPFTASWTPPVPGRYVLVALAFDDKGNVISSQPSTVIVTGGLPSVTITSPSSGTNVVQGSVVPVKVTAAGADGGIGNLKSIELLVDGAVADALPKAPPSTGLSDTPPVLTEPFIFNWKSNVTLGAHRLSARVTDNNALTISSQDLSVNVIPNRPPQITITAPSPAASLAVNVGTTITVAASDQDGTVDSVDFFVDGTNIGTVTKAPFQAVWTPMSAGTFSVTAKATDNGGASTLSAPVVVTVDPPPVSGGSLVANTVFRGEFASATETGRFALGVNRSNHGTFIGFSTNPTGRTYFYPDFPVGPDGTFSVRDSSNRVVLSGQTNATGVNGTFDGRTFIGMLTLGSGTFNPLLLTGSLAGSPNSQVVAIVGGDGSITLYASSGTAREAGADFLTSSGAYTITTPTGGRFIGTVTPTTNVVSGAVSGGVTGNFLLQQQPSRMVNISTRTLAGTGERTLVAGFVIRGTGTKPLLIRAVGPTLANFGVSNPLADPFLSVISPTALVASNNDWGNSAALNAAATQVGAFALNAGSRDAAVQVNLPSGVYTAVVDGSTATPGMALIELYDTQATAGTAQIANISTRGQVTAGDALIAGFVISGDQRKRLLIRAVGPTLANFGIAGALADPKIEVMSGTTVIVSNNDWTESASFRAVASASTAVGAFPLNADSRDAGLVVQLNPGAYTVQVTGVGGSTGTVLVEIYDADQ